MKCDQCGHEFVSTDKNPSCPQCGSAMVFESFQPGGAGAETSQGDGRTDTRWEKRTSFWDIGALVEQMKLVLLQTAPTFRTMKTSGDMASPAIFAVILGTTAAIVGSFWNILMQGVGMFQNENMMGSGGMGIGITLGMMLFSPLIVLVVLFVMSGVVHVGLMIAGGANKPYETTFRTVAYCSATSILGVVPVCGGIVGAIWNIVISITALKEMHETSTMAAAVAVLLPFLLCCGCIGAGFALGGAALFSFLSELA